MTVFSTIRCCIQKLADVKMSKKIIINTGLAPQPIGPYSQGVMVGNVLYLSGQIGVDPQTSALVKGGIAAEAEQALKNMNEVLIKANGSYENVVKTTVLLTDMSHFNAVNEVYKKFFKEKFPARSCFAVSALPMEAKVEIEAIAVIEPVTAPKI